MSSKRCCGRFGGGRSVQQASLSSTTPRASAITRTVSNPHPSATVRLSLFTNHNHSCQATCTVRHSADSVIVLTACDCCVWSGHHGSASSQLSSCGASSDVTSAAAVVPSAAATVEQSCDELGCRHVHGHFRCDFHPRARDRYRATTVRHFVPEPKWKLHCPGERDCEWRINYTYSAQRDTYSLKVKQPQHRGHSMSPCAARGVMDGSTPQPPVIKDAIYDQYTALMERAGREIQPYGEAGLKIALELFSELLHTLAPGGPGVPKEFRVSVYSHTYVTRAVLPQYTLLQPSWYATNIVCN